MLSNNRIYLLVIDNKKRYNESEETKNSSQDFIINNLPTSLLWGFLRTQILVKYLKYSFP